jgi:hypothetical protein
MVSYRLVGNASVTGMDESTTLIIMSRTAQLTEIDHL